MTETRIPIGIWLETNKGDQWANQGMTRLLGFIIEGLAIERRHIFHLVLMDYTRDEAEADLATLTATRGVDYQLHSPRDHGIEVEDFTALAEFANEHVPAVAWLTLYPGYVHARHLRAPVSAIFPDAIPLVFHDLADAAWHPKGIHVQWTENAAKGLGHAKQVVTFSHHVARDQVNRLFGFDLSKIHVVHVAPPDLAPLLPFMKDRQRTDDSLAKAATLLRRHAARESWDYLRDFPFEEVPFIAVSTQDRVTKNIRIVVEAVSRLVREARFDTRILMTARLLFGTNWTPVPNLVAAEQLLRDVISIPDLPRPEHAALYHCAEVAVHPSIFEGGMGTFPFYEAVSVGTPCLMADGPHQREMSERVPGIEAYVFDPNDARRLTDLLRRVRTDRQAVIEEQSHLFNELMSRNWGDVAAGYAAAALGRPVTA